MKSSVGIFNSSYNIPEKNEMKSTAVKVVREGIHNNTVFLMAEFLSLPMKNDPANSRVNVRLRKTKTV